MILIDHQVQFRQLFELLRVLDVFAKLPIRVASHDTPDLGGDLVLLVERFDQSSDASDVILRVEPESAV